MKRDQGKARAEDLALDNQRAERLRALSAAAASFSSSLDLDQVVSRVVVEACRLFQSAQGFILLLDDVTRRLHLRATWPTSPCTETIDPFDGALMLDSPELVPLFCQTNPISLFCSELPTALRSLFSPLESATQRVMLVPMIIDGTSRGAVGIALPDAPRDIANFDLDLAAMLGVHAAAAVRNAQSVRAVNVQLFETVARGKREWEQTFDAISDGIFISNASYVVLRANKAFAEIFEKHPRDVIGLKCHEVVRGSAEPCVQCPLTGDRQELDCRPAAITTERVADGQTYQITAYPMIEGEGEASTVVHVMKDVTDQERMQALVIRSEKLRAVGEMASGIAHDFNNLLSSIIGWSDVMLLGDLPPPVRECADAIHQAAADGAEIVKRIQEYTRIRKDTVFAAVDINDIVKGAIELARPRWKDSPEKAGISISLTTEFSDIPLTRGSASDLREVLLNIILNAVDAMPDGGSIKIRTGQQDDMVFASISDTGVGMTEDVQRNLFDPFFTTKGSTGSGLGLSVAYGIVSRHGGELQVQSQVGEGSTFIMLVPIASATEEAPPPPVARPSRRARILLIDDNERVLSATGRMLESEGHSVTKCQGGQQGVRALGKGQYDLVITDLGMPKMNGWEVAARAREVAPGTRVVLLTGWGAEIAADRLSEVGIDDVIQKPCRLADLRQLIEKTLGSHRVDRVFPSLPQKDSTESDRLHILIIEDNEWFGEALKTRLEIDGHLVSLLSSGEEGIRAIEEQDFDLVLSDLKLPRISGLAVARRRSQLNRRALVAIMTGDPGALDGSLGRDGDVDAVLPKPWKEAELHAVLERALQQRRGAGTSSPN